MDDTQVGSPDRETHLHHLDKLFSALAVNGLAINLKNVFSQFQLWNFLAFPLTYLYAYVEWI